jgi:hypothetical protein
MRLLLVVFFAETGLVLVLAPWSSFWDRNYFVQGIPVLHALVVSNFVRGAVSGVGLVNIGAAVGEMLAFFSERRSHESITSITHTHAASE